MDIIQIDAQGFDHGGTRNLAASKAIGDIFVWMTQDALFRDARVSWKFNQILCMILKLQPPMEDRYRERMPTQLRDLHDLFNYPATGVIKGMDDLPRLGIKTFFFSNVCSAVKKEAFQEVGGFPEKTIMNEDMFLAAKLLQTGL